MLFSEHAIVPAGRDGSATLFAISQPAHAWISGQILRAWAGKLDDALVLAAEQHDVAWLDWEVAPSFDPATGRPHRFRDIGAVKHAPMWERGVEHALAAWGRRVALLVSRHGSTIYTRFTDRHRLGEADAAAADGYLRRQGPLQAGWAQALGLHDGTLAHDAGMIEFADTLSLGLCGALPTPLRLEAPGPGGAPGGATQAFTLAGGSNGAFDFVLDPWPFGADRFAAEIEARVLPEASRFTDAAAMRAWLAAPARSFFTATLTRP